MNDPLTASIKPYMFNLGRGVWQYYVDDPGMRCWLMARELFTEAKCVSLARSGSKSCMRCGKRPSLRTVAEVRKEKWSMAKEGTCGKCGLRRTLVAKGLCQRCNYGDWKHLSREEVLMILAKGTVRVRGQQTSAAAPPKSDDVGHGDEAKDQLLSGAANPAFAGLLSMMSNGSGKDFVYLYFRTESDSNLYQRILEQASRNRRDPGDEILDLAERALNIGAVGATVEIGQLKKVVERMKSYPIPAGSPREVFGQTLDMVLVRLGEMEG